ncbi:LacI family transcriptional regulator [Flavobacterium franklandianum]|uniref:LacI family transcriptional regulator n=1 Tax=Flavobacterium franklandianum TaxID=2594430 RepID=A0A553CMA3_9FLAO|nr:LacI family DNA-binding transcriptional regulator [Flavobacterium franklandianum]TRX21660.1 LacI family transcriptional regulator [Flavobacterium franklandianum]TRX27829.1 LacI family transcriptional regulator [Flavobacterium franklandianum]
MNKKPVSIRNIADELKISVTTVSFVLNGKAKEKHISKETTKKVLDYAKLINYRPNQIAQSLRTGKSKILIFMVEDISNNFFSKIARIFEDIAYDLGYKVIFCSNENDDAKSNELISLFNFRQVDGFVIVPSPGIKDTIETLMKDNIPVVLLDRFFDGLECSSVVIDNEKSTFDATLHLIHNQFKNIGFITIAQEQTQMQGRLSGYVKAVNENGLKPITLEIPYDEVYKGKGKERIKDFFDKETSLDAVFFATNYLVQIGLEVFKENNPSLINNLGIVSFDDNDMYKIYSPTITSVSQPLVEISTALMEVLLPLLKKEDGMIEEPHKIILKTELIIRESSLSKKM